MVKNLIDYPVERARALGKEKEEVVAQSKATCAYHILSKFALGKKTYEELRDIAVLTKYQ